jgi:membrane protein
VYLPSALRYADRQFGELGVAFACIGWLFTVAFVLVVATVVGTVVAREPGPASRFLTGSSAGPSDGVSTGDGIHA